MTSEKMNQLMLQRNEWSTRSLYIRASDSEITVPNQPNIITSRTQNPAATSHGPACKEFIQSAAPRPSRNNATEPTSGQYEGCGT